MIEHPVFKPSFHVEVVEPEGVFLLSEQGHFVLKGELYCAIAPLLDGRHSADAIVDALADEASAAEVYYALSTMESKGYIAAPAPEISSERAAFWHAAGIDPVTAERRLRETPVAVVTAGAVAAEPFVAALDDMGIRIAGEGALTVVVTDDYLQEGLAEINAVALASGKPWLLVKPVGTQIWIGPIFRPGATACWECLAHRLRGNREVEGYLLGRTDRPAPLPIARAATPASVQLAAQLVALEAAKAIGLGTRLAEQGGDSVGLGLVLSRPQPDLETPAEGAGGSPALRGGGVVNTLETTIITLDTLTLATQRHAVVRRPQCPACGTVADPYQREPLPVLLQPQPKAYTADGGHRTVSPEQTLATYERQVSSISGAVSLLARTPVAGSDSLYVYVAGHNLAMKADSLFFLRRGLRSKSAGKGVSDAQAKASALCEAIERYSGIYQGNEPRRRAGYLSLGRSAIHPNACMLYSAAQYAQKDAVNARGGRFNRIVDPFDEEAPIDWTPVWSLTHETFKYLPTGYCYYGYSMAPEQRSSWADSNGNAAGNTLEEAILQGFFELVERDSVALWWYNRLRRPGVDLSSFAEPYTDHLRAEYGRLGRELWALDLTSDLGIPVFAALSRRVDRPVEQILMGFGAHFDPRIALLRALTEMNQMLGMAHDGAAPSDDADLDTRLWMTTATVANQPYIVPSDEPARRRADFVDWSSDDIAEDVRRCRRIVEERGLEMLVLDQTRPDIGLPVAKVFVPGLRHFWTRFAPGRLYDVPVQIGWLPAPLTEEQLNPIPMFL